jgi:hypothetical protein
MSTRPSVMGPVNDAIEFDDPMGWQHSRIDLKMRLRQRMPVLVHQFNVRNKLVHGRLGFREPGTQLAALGQPLLIFLDAGATNLD